MTPRSLFSIILKIFGLLILDDIVVSFIQSLYYFYYIFQGMEIDFTMAFATVVTIAMAALAYILIFRSDRIIDKLKLDQGFEEKQFSISLDMWSILSISIVIIGIYIITTEVPNFARLLYNYRENKVTNFGEVDTSYLVLSGSKVMLGLLLIGNVKDIVLFLYHRINGPEEEVEVVPEENKEQQ